MGKSKIEQSINQGAKQVLAFASETLKAEGVSGSLFKIGRPNVFSPAVDPKGKVSSYMLAKMSIVDFLPVYHTIDLNNVKDGTNGIADFLPQLDYGEASNYFKKDLAAQGLSDSVTGIRIYSTDDSTASDTFQNDWAGQNPLQTLTDKLSGAMQSVRSIGKNFYGGQKADTSIREKSGDLGGTILGKAGAIFGGDEKRLKEIGKALGGSAADVIFKGNKIHLPTFWQNSTYTSTFQLTTKLVSPYGHPNAVAKFIMEPLLYMFTLFGAKTKDGISVGQGFPLTISGYGSTFVSLGTVRTMTLQRGGSETSYNIFRQPLTINVTLDIQNLVGGFAGYHNESEKNPDKNIAKDIYHLVSGASQGSHGGSSQASGGAGWAESYGQALTKNMPLVNTPGKIIQSLKPINVTPNPWAHEKGGFRFYTPESDLRTQESNEDSERRQANQNAGNSVGSINTSISTGSQEHS